MMSIFIRLSLFLLLGLSVPVAAQTLSLPLETMPNKAFADVKAQAQAEAVSGPVWGNAPDPSTLPVHVTLSGTVTADATMTKLAIFSDDGCDVFVDGTRVWNAKDNAQALPDLANSLHELPVTLSPGSHTVEIDYSNTIYTVADAPRIFRSQSHPEMIPARQITVMTTQFLTEIYTIRISQDARMGRIHPGATMKSIDLDSMLGNSPVF